MNSNSFINTNRIQFFEKNSTFQGKTVFLLNPFVAFVLLDYNHKSD